MQGTYQIETVLGQGGFGITYRAQDSNLRRAVAIKEFFPIGCRRATQRVSAGGTWSKSTYQEARQRFLEEGQTLARFNHPGIVRVFAAFEENESAYIVMELVSGQTLQSLLEQKGRLPEAEALDLILRVGEALEEVHRMDLLHRDIKPPNILLCGDGRIVLVDFGTARQFASGVTSKHSVMLTPGYAPLEQYAERGRRGPYTDVYSLAATLYHLLSGSFPESATERAAGLPLSDLVELCPGVSPQVAAAVARGMHMDIAQRPQSVAEFLLLLRPVPAQPVAIPPVEVVSAKPSPPPVEAVAKPLAKASSSPERAISAPAASKAGPVPAKPVKSACLGCAGAGVVLFGLASFGSVALVRHFWPTGSRAAGTPHPSASAQATDSIPKSLWNAQRGVEECSESLKETAAALQKYSSQHKGQYPEKLEQLVPTFVPKLPTCPAVAEQLPAYYEVSTQPQAFTLSCRSNHSDAGVAHYFPRYSSNQGAVANEPMLSQKPSTDVDFATRGWALNSLSRYREAIQDFAQAERLEPNYGFAYWQHADALMRMGKPGEALPLVRKAVQLEPDNADYRNTLLYVLYGTKDLARQESELEQWSRRPQSDGGAALGVARYDMIYHQLRFGESRAACQESWAKSKDYAGYYRLYEFFCSLGEGEAANIVRDGERLLEYQGYRQLESSAEVCAYVSLAYEMLGQKEKAHSFLVRAVPQLRPGWGGPLALYAAGSLDEKGLLAEAGDDLGRLTEAHTLIGLFASVRGNKSRAREHLTWVVNQGLGSYLEYPIAKAWLGRL